MRIGNRWEKIKNNTWKWTSEARRRTEKEEDGKEHDDGRDRENNDEDKRENEKDEEKAEREKDGEKNVVSVED